MDTKTYEEFLIGLESSDLETRWQTAGNRELAKDARFIDPLIRVLLNDPEYGPRCGAAYTLALFQDEKAHAALIKALADKDYRVRQTVVENLYEKATPEMIGLLIARLGDESRAVAQEVPDTLSEIGEAVTGPVIEALASDNPQVRYYAVLTLGNLGSEEALRALEQVRDNDQTVTSFGANVSELAAKTLKRIKITN